MKINSKQELFSSSIDIIFKYDLNEKSLKIIGNYPYGLKEGKSNEVSFDYPSSLSIDGKDNIM